MMEGSAAGAQALATKVAPPNPTERLGEALDQLGSTVDSLQNCLHRAHEKSYGEYNYAPTDEAEIPEIGGRISELRERVKAIHNNARMALEVAESMEGKG
jgi:hypothetical protein